MQNGFSPPILISLVAEDSTVSTPGPLRRRHRAAALQKAGLRDQVIVMVGGAPVTQEYADVVGADGYASDASAAVVRAKELLQQRRATIPA